MVCQERWEKISGIKEDLSLIHLSRRVISTRDQTMKIPNPVKKIQFFRDSFKEKGSKYQANDGGGVL